MTAQEPSPTQPFQFRLRTLLLLCVVLGSSLAVFGGWGIVVFGLVVGLAIYLYQTDSSLSSPHFVLVAIFVIGALVWLFLPFIFVAREAARRPACANNLRQIGAALQAYHQEFGCFPPAYIADKSGKPMHSWRMFILPYMDYRLMQTAYDFNEPWDGPKNKQVAATSLPSFICPSDHASWKSVAARTSYVAVVGPNAAWEGAKPRKLSDFGPDASTTIMLVEVVNSGIDWAEPRDLWLDSPQAANKMPAMAMAAHQCGNKDDFLFTYEHGASVHVAMADGRVRFLKTDGLSDDDLREVLEVGACADGKIGSRLVVDDDQRRVNWPNIAALAVWLLSVGTLLVGAVRSRKRRAASLNSPVDR
jgi:hypothetical protein